VATIPPNFGTVRYSSAQNPGDSVNVQVKGLTPPPQGETYTVWLYNTRRERSLKLGSLRLDPLGDGQLSFTGDPMLPIAYNAVLITQESGDNAEPTGRVAYSGSVPEAVMFGLREILIASADGIPPADAEGAATEAPSTGGAETPEAVDFGSLLDGALEEANIGLRHSGLAAEADSPGSLRTHAEHTINILRGTLEDHNGNGRGENPGRGYGIAYFTGRIQEKLDAIADSPTTDRQIENQVELIRVCIVNVRGWMDQVVDLESQMLTVDDLESVHAQLVEASEWANALVNGVDLNQNGQVEPFEGECGLQQISDYGITVGNITIFAGALPESS
jgi:hypothetical protein